MDMRDRPYVEDVEKFDREWARSSARFTLGFLAGVGIFALFCLFI